MYGLSDNRVKFSVCSLIFECIRRFYMEFNFWSRVVMCLELVPKVSKSRRVIDVVFNRSPNQSALSINVLSQHFYALLLTKSLNFLLCGRFQY